MSTPLTLESLQADFQLWRQNKSSPRNRIPDNLKQKAVALLQDMSPGKITRTLGISRAMLKTWDAQRAQISDTTTAIEFVSLPVAPQLVSSDIGNLTLDLNQPNGNHWRIQGQASASQLNAFVRSVGLLPSGAQ